MNDSTIVIELPVVGVTDATSRDWMLAYATAAMPSETVVNVDCTVVAGRVVLLVEAEA